MADNGSLVTISGAALSLLLYENVRSLGDQIGFLVGEVLVYVTKNVTDSDRQVENIKTHVDIKTIITSPTTNWLHNGLRQVNKEKLKEIIRHKSKNIVGWYHFRKNESLVPTLQDKVLHNELNSAIFGSGIANKNKQFFTMCLLNTSISNIGGTHKFRHVFFRYKNGIFEPIPLRIKNLGDDSSRPDGSDYKPTPVRTSFSEPDVFTKIIKSLNLDVSRMPGTELVTRIERAAEYHLDNMIPKLTSSDREIANLERQVRQMRAKIIAIKLSKIESGKEGKECSYIAKLNSQREKNDIEREKVKEENKISTIKLKNELIDIFNDDNNSINSKHQSTTQRQLSHSNKQRNLGIQSQKNLNFVPKNVNQDHNITPKEKSEFEISSTSSAVNDPFASVVADMKMEITENNTPNREKRSQSKESSSSPEILSQTLPAYNTESISSSGSLTRGYGRGTANRSDVNINTEFANTGSKKARRGRSKTVSERLSLSSQATDNQDKPKVVAKLEFPISNTLSYSQAAARKSNDAGNTSRSSDSQEY